MYRICYHKSSWWVLVLGGGRLHTSCWRILVWFSENSLAHLEFSPLFSLYNFPVWANSLSSHKILFLPTKDKESLHGEEFYPWLLVKMETIVLRGLRPPQGQWFWQPGQTVQDGAPESLPPPPPVSRVEQAVVFSLCKMGVSHHSHWEPAAQAPFGMGASGSRNMLFFSPPPWEGGTVGNWECSKHGSQDSCPLCPLAKPTSEDPGWPEGWRQGTEMVLCSPCSPREASWPIKLAGFENRVLEPLFWSINTGCDATLTCLRFRSCSPLVWQSSSFVFPFLKNKRKPKPWKSG